MVNKKSRKVQWGDIFYCNLGDMKGSVQCGLRPVIVIQSNRLNRKSPTVVVAVITSVIKKTNMPQHILIGKECGLNTQSMIMLEQTRTVDKETELLDYIGSVKEKEKILEIKRGIRSNYAIQVKPQPSKHAYIFALCPKCRSEFMMVPENIVRRVDPYQLEKHTCSKCQVGYKVS